MIAPAHCHCFSLEGVAVHRGVNLVLQVPLLHLPAGRTTAIVGPSGAGKSTLLRLLGGLETPSIGTVHACGPQGEPLLPGKVVMVFQRPVLLRGTVRDNVAVGLRLRGARQIPARIDPMLERLGLAKKRHQSVRTLSGGEHQRVALARALVLQPTALLLDEPTANLDPRNVRLIETLIREVQAETGMTVVWVTHQPLQARRVAHSVLFLLEGKVVEHAEVNAFFSESASQHTRDFLEGRLVW